MPLSITSDVKGLEFLKELTAGRKLSKNLKKSLGEQSNLLHSAIQFEVIKEYSKPNNKTLASVRLRNSISLEKTGTNLVSNGIEYAFKPVPLHQFPHKENRISAKSKYRLKGSFRIHDKDYADEVFVKVKKSFKKVHGRGYGGFKIKNSRRKGIFERKQERTWTNVQDQRASIRLLFGPSLSQMANTVYKNNNPLIKKAKLNFRLNILKTVSKL